MIIVFHHVNITNLHPHPYASCGIMPRAAYELQLRKALNMSNNNRFSNPVFKICGKNNESFYPPPIY